MATRHHPRLHGNAVLDRRRYCINIQATALSSLYHPPTDAAMETSLPGAPAAVRDALSEYSNCIPAG